jgi:hypothetical protein
MVAYSMIVERVPARTDDGRFDALILIYDFHDGGRVERRVMTGRGESCTARDGDTWTIDESGVTLRRVNE